MTDEHETGTGQLARDDAGRDVARLWVAADASALRSFAWADLASALDRLAVAHGVTGRIQDGIGDR